MIQLKLFWADLKDGQWKEAVRWFNRHPKQPWEQTGFVVSFWFFRITVTRRADGMGRW